MLTTLSSCLLRNGHSLLIYTKPDPKILHLFGWFRISLTVFNVSSMCTDLSCLLEAKMDYHAFAHLLSETNGWWCSMLRPSIRNTKRLLGNTIHCLGHLIGSCLHIPLAGRSSSVFTIFPLWTGVKKNFDTYWKLTRGFFFNVKYWITVASTTLKIVDKSHKKLNMGSFQRCPQHYRK